LELHLISQNLRHRHLDFIKAGFYASLPFTGAFVGVLCSGALSDWLYRRGFSLGFARKLPIVSGLVLSTTIIGANFVDHPALIILFLSLVFFTNGLALDPLVSCVGDRPRAVDRT
jgi:ACS family D-galactonate transporter-like MFS transporter